MGGTGGGLFSSLDHKLAQSEPFIFRRTDHGWRMLGIFMFQDLHPLECIPFRAL